MRLADIGMKEADLERAARIATEAPYPNPRKVEYAPVLELLRTLTRVAARLEPGGEDELHRVLARHLHRLIASRGTITV